MSQEEVIYSDENVSVSTSRIVIRGTTYALRNITSVKMTMTPAKKGCAFLIIGVALFLAFGALLSQQFIGALAVLIFFGGVGILWAKACKPEYHVTFASSSGEANALTTKDRSYIEKIVSSINDAIVRCK